MTYGWKWLPWVACFAVYVNSNRMLSVLSTNFSTKPFWIFCISNIDILYLLWGLNYFVSVPKVKVQIDFSSQVKFLEIQSGISATSQFRFWLMCLFFDSVLRLLCRHTPKLEILISSGKVGLCCLPLKYSPVHMMTYSSLGCSRDSAVPMTKTWLISVPVPSDFYLWRWQTSAWHLQ